MRHRSLVAIFALTFLAALPLGAAPAGAAEDPPDTRCLAEFEVTLTPGISNTPASGTLTTNGETGSIACFGPVNGHEPTGVGTRGEDGVYGVTGPNSCDKLDGVSDWTIYFTMPTDGGDQRLRHDVSGHYGPLEGPALMGGTFSGDRMYGTWEITPLDGDCVTTPITRVLITCDEWLVNGEPDLDVAA